METHEVILEIPLEHERNLFGGLDCHVKKIERTLRISVILRDGAVKLVGSKSAVEQAKNVFSELLTLSERGNTITEQNVDYVLALSKEHSDVSLAEIDKERLLYGNWKIRPAAGMYFKTENFTFVDAVPKNIVAYARSWDLAATEPTPLNPDPDATAGVLMGLLDDGRVIVLDVKRKQIKANDARNLLRNMAAIDQGKYKFVQITIPQDPGQAGKAQAQSLVSMLAGYSVEIVSPTGSKEVRATPFASQVQAGNVLILKGEWNDMYLSELESFPESKHDDMVDASSDAFNKLMNSRSWGGLTS